MANAIELAKSYVPKLDEVYKLASLTAQPNAVAPPRRARTIRTPAFTLIAAASGTTASDAGNCPAKTSEASATAAELVLTRPASAADHRTASLPN